MLSLLVTVSSVPVAGRSFCLLSLFRRSLSLYAFTAIRSSMLIHVGCCCQKLLLLLVTDTGRCCPCCHRLASSVRWSLLADLVLPVSQANKYWVKAFSCRQSLYSFRFFYRDSCKNSLSMPRACFRTIDRPGMTLDRNRSAYAATSVECE